jgi:YD repeat-containing protein
LRKITRITDPSGGVTAFGYDGSLNLTSQTDPLGRVTKFNYDNNGNVTATTDANGQATQTAYELNFKAHDGIVWVKKCWKTKHLMRYLPVCLEREAASGATRLSHRTARDSRLPRD